MKKLLSLIAVGFVFLTSTFALDLGDIKGTWKDTNWDAKWTFSADGKILLTDKNGDTVYTFTDDNIKDYKLDVKTTGVSISFYCKDTQRAYKFNKPITLNADLDMHINPDWTTEDYDVKIKWQ